MFSPAAKLEPGAAILYGRFSARQEVVFNNKLALWLQNTDTKHNVYIYFDEQPPVYVAQVKAGRYRIAGFVGVDRGHKVMGRREFTSHGKAASISAPFDAAEGAEVYLGDFIGQASFDGTVFEWHIDSVTNNFAATTEEFREHYPNLRSMAVTPVWKLQSNLQQSLSVNAPAVRLKP